MDGIGERVDELDRVFRERQDMPVYRELHGDVAVDRITSTEDWRSLPLLDKETLLARSDGSVLLRPDAEPVAAGATSGTSGSMATVLKTQADVDALREQFRPRLGDMFPAGSRTVLVQDPQWSYDAIRFLHEADRFAAMGSSDDLGFTAHLLAEVGADGIYTTTSTALRLGAVMADAPVDPDRIDRVVLGGEGLSDAAQADLEERFPAATIYQTYGSRELGYVGYQCDDLAGTNTYHTVPGLYVHEVVDPETGEPLPPGETGELVTTTLWNGGMAFTRYRTGDAATLTHQDCTCDTDGPVLALEGKIAFDSIKLQGVTVYRDDVEAALDRVDGVSPSRYQVRVAEEETGRGVLPRVTVVVPADVLGDRDPGRAAAELMDVLHVGRERTWQDMVDADRFLPLTVEPAGSVADGLKTRRVVDERTG